MFDSEFERNLFELRKTKLAQIEDLGQSAYTNQFPASDTVPQVRAKWGDTQTEDLENHRVTVAVAGRLMQIRAQGKAGVATLQQGGERLQIYVRLDAVGEQAFSVYKLLDLGDHIGVSGYLFRTRTGELTVHVERLGEEALAASDAAAPSPSASACDAPNDAAMAGTVCWIVM